MSWVDGALTFGAFLVALSIHECAHAWTAWTLGDATGRAQGRISLNPARHIDPFGTVLLPLLLMFGPWRAGGGYGIPFGYAKPVPYNPYVLRNPASGMALIAGAGPLSNVLLAFVTAALLGALARAGVAESTLGMKLLGILVPLNVRLAVFNLIPIAPLDGSALLAAALPRNVSRSMGGVERYGFLVLIVLSASGLLARITDPVEHTLLEPLARLAGRTFLG